MQLFWKNVQHLTIQKCFISVHLHNSTATSIWQSNCGKCQFGHVTSFVVKKQKLSSAVTCTSLINLKFGFFINVITKFHWNMLYWMILNLWASFTFLPTLQSYCRKCQFGHVTFFVVNMHDNFKLIDKNSKRDRTHLDKLYIVQGRNSSSEVLQELRREVCLLHNLDFQIIPIRKNVCHFLISKTIRPFCNTR